MELTIFKPEYYVNAITHKKYNPKKNYTHELLIKITPKDFKPVIKNILMLDNAFSKIININANEIATNLDMPNQFTSSNEENKKVWADFMISYQNALKPELIRVDKEINELKKNLGKKQNNKKFELLSFYKSNLEEMINMTFETLSDYAYNKVVNDLGDLPSTLVSIANLYRHAKEYDRQRKMFYSMDLCRGLSFNKEKIHTLLKEIAENTSDSPYLKEVSRLYNLAVNNQNTLKYENKKLKKDSVDLKEYVQILDNAYLKRINLLKYVELYYYNKIEYLHKEELDKTTTPINRLTYLRNEYVNLTRTNNTVSTKLTEILNSLDNAFFGFNVNNENLIHQFAVVDQVINSEQDLRYSIDSLNKEFKSSYEKLLDSNGKLNFTPFIDKHSYTLKDFFSNNPEIVDELTKPATEIKENSQENETPKQENNDFKEELINSTVITPKKDDLPTVDPNLPLDKKIDAYFSGLIGLNEVKETLLEIIAKKLLEGKNYKQGQMHMAFLGNPGTGKTTVARITGKILYENGLINSDKVVECKFSDLYQNYVGFSAKATQEKIKEAEGGILFIDEAHQLATTDGSSKDFRKEIINVLVPELENNKNLLVIFAGYSKEMLEMLTGSDKGLFSRVSHRITFKDFSRQDISKLFKLEMSKKKNRNDENFVLTDEAETYVEEYFNVLIKARHDNFANGREVRVAVNKILNRFGVIALKRDDIKTIDGDTMKEILTSSCFESDIMTNNENDQEVINAWNNFKNLNLQAQAVCYA